MVGSVCRAVDAAPSRGRVPAFAAAALAAALVGLVAACDGNSRASDGEPLCLDRGPLPIGERPPAPDAICADPPSPLSLAAEAQRRANREAAVASAAELQRRDAITVVTCGTGTPIPSDRAQACTAVFVNGLFLLFDAGDGAERSIERSLLPIEEIDAVFLTHFHSDHLADLGEVVSRSWILGRTGPLPVHGGPSIRRVVDGFNAVYALDDLYRTTHHGTDILPAEVARAEAREIADPGPAGAVVFERDGVTVRAFRVDHAPVEPALGYRVEFGGRAVVVSGDTTASEGLRENAVDADLLVAEVFNREVLEAAECALQRMADPRQARLVRDIRGYHVDTAELAELARSAGVRRLVLTHLVPSVDNGDTRADLFFGTPVRAGFAGEVTTARDGERFVVPLE